MSETSAPIHRQLGLTDDEFARIPELIGREPRPAELVMFSLMWSEHCSYKHSRPLLGAFPTEGPRVVQGPGENAGAVDVGDGIVAIFKVESHNHPSAVEPFEGAATGVGGIVRDILAMGARPIALLDSLRFGPLTSPRSRHLFAGAVDGIGHYGNCIGVPTVGGEVAFEECYEDSCLVNAMCVGVARADRILSAAAEGVGNTVVLIGNRTGRDGIGGASVLASAELGADRDLRPSVQVSDPFTERKLIDCCLELADRDLLVALQDLGAAGLTSAASEMASKGGVGLDLDLDLVPLREPLTPAEILVSESQERMLAVVTPGDLPAVLEACARWELEASAIGTVTELRRFVAHAGGEMVVDLPAESLTDQAPVYEVPLDPAPVAAPLDLADVPPPADLAAAWGDLMAEPTIASKRWVYQQYDHLVGAGTIVRPGGDAAVVRIPGTARALGLTLDGAERHCQLDPRAGGRRAVLEAARNLACVGARPIGATDCLNFGNPEKPPTGWRLAEVIGGMSDALRALGTPIVSGNVSLYNESRDRVVYPTPVVGMVGLVEHAERSLAAALARDGDAVMVIGCGVPRLDGSIHLGPPRGRPPEPDLGLEAALCDVLATSAELGMLHSAHDVSTGGLAVSLAETAIAGGRGLSVVIDADGRADEVLFGEGAAWVVVSLDPSRVRDLEDRLTAAGLTIVGRGETGGDDVVVRLADQEVRMPVADAARRYEQTIPAALEVPA